MKISHLSTDRALDVLCELTPYIANITEDKEIMGVFSEKMDTQNMTILSVKIISVSRYNSMLSILLKTHRSDIYSILSIINDKSKEEIAAQTVMETMRQISEVLHDEELLSFFKSFVPQAKNEPSAPSVPSRA